MIQGADNIVKNLRERLSVASAHLNLPTDLTRGKSINRRASCMPCHDRELSNEVYVKQGYLFKHSKHIHQRWRKCYFKLRHRKLYYANSPDATIFNEVDLIDQSIAEHTQRGTSHAFQIITPFSSLLLCADSRKDMEEWMHALRAVGNREFYESGGDQYKTATSGQHNWYVSSHARPTYCNVCREALSGVAWHGLSCEVCKIKTHKRCAIKVQQFCKWATLENVIAEQQNVGTDDHGVYVMPHQWLEGNLPVSAKCNVCDRTCGSVLRLQDWRCLWCKACVHTACRESYPIRCPLGVSRISVLLPISIKALSPTGEAELCPCARMTGSPLLVFVNTKSGQNQGMRFLRRFKQLLNPAQVYDLMNGGPEFGLRFFAVFDSFRVLVCGGDGSVGWVLTALDKLELHAKCQVGVLPLGTGNDLARVLGWGNEFDNEGHLASLVEKFERAQTKMLDRWSVMMYEGETTYHKAQQRPSTITQYEDSVASKISKILASDDHSVVISSAKSLCETVKDFLSRVQEATQHSGLDEDKTLSAKSDILKQKLDSLLKTLDQESAASSRTQILVDESDVADSARSSSVDTVSDLPVGPSKNKHQLRRKEFMQREALMNRANSLKKAIRQIIEQTERVVDEQNRQTATQQRRKYRNLKKISKLTLRRTSSSRSPTRSPTPSGASGSNDSPPPPCTPTLAASAAPNLDFNLCVDTEVVAVDDDDLAVAEVPPPDPEIPASRQGMKLSLTPPVDAHARINTLFKTTSAEGDSLGAGLLVPSIAMQPPTPCITPVNSQVDLHLITTTGSTQTGLIDQLRAPRGQELSATSAEQKRRRFSHSVSSSEPMRSSDATGSSELTVDNETPGASRRVSTGSTFRSFDKSFDRSPSPTRLNLPAMRRGLLTAGLTGGSLIAEVLLMNADLLGWAAPLMDFEDVPIDNYIEKQVMNNYFGIGLDAKIALEFNEKRDEVSKPKTRTKLYMWYGMLGTKELLQRTYKNLEQRVHLECDGHRIRLPSLQGIVVLNIPSYQGGMNFWGNEKADKIFSAQSFDDKILEVVAIFGVIHCATSRVISLQNHRIAQCRQVKISITGQESIPVQVDGEAWMQPPGYIQIVHKNRAQVLVRNRQFEATLKTWAERQRIPERRVPACLLHIYTLDECHVILGFLETANQFLLWLGKACAENAGFETRMRDSMISSAAALQRVYPPKRLSEAPPQVASLLNDVQAPLRQLYIDVCAYWETDLSAADMSVTTADELSTLMDAMSGALKEFAKVLLLCRSTTSLDIVPQPSTSTGTGSNAAGMKKGAGRTKHRFAAWLRSKTTQRKAKVAGQSKRPVMSWSVQDVADWLKTIDLEEYSDNFISHDVRGVELLQLERGDLKDLGIEKVGHLKRLQQAIQELCSLQERESHRAISEQANLEDSFSSIG